MNNVVNFSLIYISLGGSQSHCVSVCLYVCLCLSVCPSVSLSLSLSQSLSPASNSRSSIFSCSSLSVPLYPQHLFPCSCLSLLHALCLIACSRLYTYNCLLSYNVLGLPSADLVTLAGNYSISLLTERRCLENCRRASAIKHHLLLIAIYGYTFDSAIVQFSGPTSACVISFRRSLSSDLFSSDQTSDRHQLNSKCWRHVVLIFIKTDYLSLLSLLVPIISRSYPYQMVDYNYLSFLFLLGSITSSS